VVNDRFFLDVGFFGFTLTAFARKGSKSDVATALEKTPSIKIFLDMTG
jgi:hypothetical protein